MRLPDRWFAATAPGDLAIDARVAEAGHVRAAGIRGGPEELLIGRAEPIG
jgi:hypothetical protein